MFLAFSGPFTSPGLARRVPRPAAGNTDPTEGPAETPGAVADDLASVAGDRTQDPRIRATIEECFEVVRHLMKRYPHSSDPLALMGSLYKEFDQTDEAVTWWRKCLERDPGRADVYHGLGMMALKRDRFEKAAEYWRQAQQVDPDLRGVYGRYGQALLGMGKPAEAAKALEKEVRRSPHLGEFHFLLGQAYLEMKAYAKAIEACQEARRLRPEDPRIPYAIATAYGRMGNPEKAAEYRREFKRLQTRQDEVVSTVRRAAMERNTQRPWKVLAWTLTRAGQVHATHRHLHKAEALWLRAGRIDRENWKCRELLVDLYLHTHRPAKALPHCRRLIEINPEQAVYHLNTGVVLAQLERFDAAEQAIRKSLELDPKRPPAYRSLVRLLLIRQARPSKIQPLAEDLVRLEKGAENYALLALVRFRAGDTEGAREALKEAEKRDARHPEVRRVRRMIEEGA